MKKTKKELNQIKGLVFRRPMPIDEEIEVAKTSEYARWFRCLKMSQVYTEYSRAVVSGKRPENIEIDSAIKKTYANFGDVRRFSFDNWWREKGRYLFVLNQSLKKVKVISKELELDILSLSDNKLVLEIPLTVTRPTVMRQISKLVKQAYESRPPVNIYKEAPIRVKRQNNKIRMTNVDSLLNVLDCIEKYEDKKLAEIGEIAGLSIDLFSRTTEQIFDPDDQALYKRRMTLAVARCASNAENLVDNAIRGIFPSFTRVDKQRSRTKKRRY